MQQILQRLDGNKPMNCSDPSNEAEQNTITQTQRGVQYTQERSDPETDGDDVEESLTNEENKPSSPRGGDP